jgi:hypothetical protein
MPTARPPSTFAFPVRLEVKLLRAPQFGHRTSPSASTVVFFTVREVYRQALTPAGDLGLEIKRHPHHERLVNQGIDARWGGIGAVERVRVNVDG